MPSREALLTLVSASQAGAHGLSLPHLGRRSGWSPWYVHRRLRMMLGETGRQYSLRQQVARAAARLVTTGQSVDAVSRDTGFSHCAVLIRAFRRVYGITPGRYARLFRRKARPVRLRHARLTSHISPCLGLYRMPLQSPSGRTPMTDIAITHQLLDPMPVLFIRVHTTQAELQQAFATSYGRLFGYCQANGIALAGFPLAVYVNTGTGLWTVDAAMPVAEAVSEIQEEGIEAGSVGGGAVAHATHCGPYDSLPQTHAAIEAWIADQGYEVGGAPWEWYVTDPGEHPDPKDWRTEVYWPLKA